jgi:CMP-N-acetylneuraminic acid synthetase
MITAVVAVRAGSQRVKNKNIKPFGSSNMLDMKLNILKSVRNIEKIVVNSDSDEMLEIALKNNVSTHKREGYYASSECTNSEFHGHIAEVTDSDTIFLSPVCSPFVSVESHEKAIDYDLTNVPNSQDLPDVVKLNYGITLVDREVMKKEKRVVGNKPGFYKLNEFESIDIDTEFDFFIAEQIYKKYYKGVLC